MDIRMSQAEQTLLTSFLQCARSYLEFGAGGSTILASRLVKGPVYSVESDGKWATRVREEIKISPFSREILHVDVGPTKDWGYPMQPHGEVNYLNYHENIWDRIPIEVDIFLIDGRFRVASFCQCLLRSHANSVFAVHDYRSRTYYHVMEDVANPLAEAGDLVIFQRSPRVCERDISSLLLKYALDVA